MKKSRDEEEEDRQAFFAVIPLVTTAVHRPRSCEHAPAAAAVAAAMQDNMDGAGRRAGRLTDVDHRVYVNNITSLAIRRRRARRTAIQRD